MTDITIEALHALFLERKVMARGDWVHVVQFEAEVEGGTDKWEMRDDLTKIAVDGIIDLTALAKWINEQREHFPGR